MASFTITDPESLAQRLADGETPVLLDVREDWEYQTCHLPDSLHVPMGQIPSRLDEIPADRPVVCICHHGGRSEQVARYLAAQGRESVENLAGGVDAWSLRVDPGMPRY